MKIEIGAGTGVKTAFPLNNDICRVWLQHVDDCSPPRSCERPYSPLEAYGDREVATWDMRSPSSTCGCEAAMCGAHILLAQSWAECITNMPGFNYDRHNLASRMQIFSDG